VLPGQSAQYRGRVDDHFGLRRCDPQVSPSSWAVERKTTPELLFVYFDRRFVMLKTSNVRGRPRLPIENRYRFGRWDVVVYNSFRIGSFRYRRGGSSTLSTRSAIQLCSIQRRGAKYTNDVLDLYAEFGELLMEPNAGGFDDVVVKLAGRPLDLVVAEHPVTCSGPGIPGRSAMHP